MKRTVFLTLTSAAALAASGCGNGGTPTPVPPANVYYNLIPGLCGEYSNDAGGRGPSVGVHIQIATNPPGIELLRVKHGLMEENDFLSFDPDGGGVLLARRDLSSSAGQTQEIYTTPLKYLAPPPLENQTLESTSVCQSGSACMSMDLNVSVQSSSPYTGPYSTPDGGQVETQLYFTYTYDGDGGLAAQKAGIVPGIGFTDLYLVDDTMNLSHYLLVDIITDGGACGNN